MAPEGNKDPRNEKNQNGKSQNKGERRDDEPGKDDDFDSDFKEQEEGFADKDFDEFAEDDDDFDDGFAGDKSVGGPPLLGRIRYRLLTSEHSSSKASPRHRIIYQLRSNQSARSSQFPSGRAGVSILMKHLRLSHNLASGNASISQSQNDPA